MAESIISQMTGLVSSLTDTMEDVANRETLVQDGLGSLGMLKEVRHEIQHMIDEMLQAQAEGKAIEVIFNPVHPRG